MKTVDLGLLSAGVALALALGGVLLVLLDVPVPDRWPHAREPEAPTVQEDEYEAIRARTDDVEARIRRLEQRLQELERAASP